MKYCDEKTFSRVKSLVIFGILLLMIFCGLYWYIFDFFPRKRRYVPPGPIYTEQYIKGKVKDFVNEAIQKKDWTMCSSLPSSVKYFSIYDSMRESVTGQLQFDDFVVWSAQEACVIDYIEISSDSEACGNYYQNELDRDECLKHLHEKRQKVSSEIIFTRV